MLTLYPHQKKLLDLNPPRHLIGWDCRLGKTIGVLELANKNNTSALIVVPKHLKENWTRNASAYPQDHLIVTKEELRSKWQTLPKKDAIVGDECQLLCGAGKNGTGSQIAKAMFSYMKKHDIKYRWFLSATPVNSDLRSAYMLLRHLGQEINYWGFMKTYFNQIRMGNRMVPVEKSSAKKDIAELLKTVGTFLKMEEVIGLPEEIDDVEYFDLNAQQKKAIKEIDEPMAMVQYQKEHQIENFALKSDGYLPDQFFPSDKLDRIIDLVQETDKTVIFCKYRLQIDAIRMSIKDVFNGQIFEIHGDVHDRDAVILQAEAAKKAVIIIIVDCNTGYELASFTNTIFASLPWSYVAYYQCRKRVKTMDTTKAKTNVYITLLTTKGIDQEVKNSLDNKSDFHLDLFIKKA